METRIDFIKFWKCLLESSMSRMKRVFDRKNWHSLVTIVVRPSLYGDHVDLVSLDQVYMEYINPFHFFFFFFQLLAIPWSCNLHWGDPLVNGVNWKHHQVGLEILSENGFSTKTVIIPVASFLQELKRERFQGNGLYNPFPLPPLHLKWVVVLLCKVYYFGQFMSDVHYETMARIWLVKYKISKYSSMPKKRGGLLYWKAPLPRF